MSWFSFRFQDFGYSFLSILFEGMPFLLFGSVLSGIVDAFVPSQMLTRLLPKNRAAAIVLSGLLGGIFPMCECGSVVVIRRFIKKGLPVPCAITYMLAAPIVNPVVALSTFAAFRGQHAWVMMSLRLLLGFLIPVTVGFIAQQIPVRKLLRDHVLESLPDGRSGNHEPEPGFRKKIHAALQSTTADFLDVALFLVIGAAIASVFNTSVNQQIIQPLAANPALATVSMMALAVGLALCSTTDAFIAASFVTFPYFAKLAFLVFGAMFDVKLFFLYGLVFRRRCVVALAVGLFITIALICIRLAAIPQWPN